MPRHPRLLLAATLLAILIMGIAGSWVGTLGRPQPQPDPIPADAGPSTTPNFPPLIADLAKDWSNTTNPNVLPFGTWSFNQAATPLTKIDRWAASADVPGWGPQANRSGDFLPFVCQATFDAAPNNALGVDFKPGDIILHSTDSTNSPRDGLATISFQSAIAGTATIKGRLWPTRDLGRTNDFEFILRGSGPAQSLASGTLPEGGAITRDNPVSIDIPSIRLRKDDSLHLVIYRNFTSDYGDFTALNLTIAIIPDNPAPAASASQPAPKP